MVLTSSGGRLIVLGFDGLTWSVVDELLSQEKLPNIKKVVEGGSSWNLRSTVPPLTPAAWSTIFSGLAPFEHGVFDFTTRERGTYHFRLCKTVDRRADMFWHIVGREGKKVVVLNVPLTFPAEEVNGMMISGMDAPDLDGAVFPKSALPSILAFAPDYTVDAMSHWFDSRDLFFQHLWEMHNARQRLAFDLFDRQGMDVFIAVYVLADRVQHVAWEDVPSAQIVKAYCRLDKVVGGFLSRLQSDDTLVILSDHGFQSSRGEICLNKVLHDEGLLCLDSAHVRRVLKHFESARLHTRGRRVESRGALWSLPPRAVWFDAVDWSRTRVAAYGLIGNLMVNQRGRDPRGCVSDGREKREVLGRARSAVEKFLCGKGVKGDVVLHEVEVGSHKSEVVPPDGILEIDNYRIGTWGGREFVSSNSVVPNEEGHRGVHAEEGVLMAYGGRVCHNPDRRYANVVQVTPTLLDVLGLGSDGDLPGRSLL